MTDGKHPRDNTHECRHSAMTLGDLLEAGIDVFCWCNGCRHNAVVAAASLAVRLGRPMPVPAVGGRMRCTVCGGRNVSTRPAWPSPDPITRHA